MENTVARAVVSMLATAGVRRGYTVPGESFLELLDAFRAEPALTLVSTRHEGGASFMAEADGKLHGLPAVVMGSRGPGAANLSIGVHTACQDGTPMLVLLGQVPSDQLGRESFQEVDLAAFFRPLARFAAEARTAEEVPPLLAEALGRTCGARPGPAVLSVPVDFWSRPWRERLPVPPAAAPGDPVARARETAGLVDAARAPVVITGCQDRTARAELVAASDELGFAVYNAFRRQDAFPEDHPHYAGHLGLGVPDEQLEALRQADLVLVLGTRLDQVTTQGHRLPAADQPTVQVDGAVTPFLRELRSMCTAEKRDWRTANTAVREFMTPPEPGGTNGVHPTEVVRTVRELAPQDALVTSDAGNFAGFLHRYWCFTEPRTQLAPCNGAMGYAVPAAVAAKLAEPDRTVIAMAGDGGALMTGQEIETAVRHEAQVIVVVFRNGLYGTIAMHQARTHGRLTGVSIGGVDLAGWARGLGAAGFTVDNREQLAPAIGAALRERRPSLVDVRTDPDVITADTRLTGLLGQS